MADVDSRAPFSDQTRPPTYARRRTAADLLYLVLALTISVPAVTAAWMASSSGTFAATSFFSRSDDAFYYFVIASRWASGQGSTFDGLHATNGYQPLWEWISLVLFALLQNPAAGAAAVMTVSAALWVVAVALVRAVAIQLSASGSGVVAMALAALVVVRTWFDGMEFPLVVVVALAMVWVTLRSRALSIAGPDQQAAMALGGLGAVAVLTRLDMLAFVVLVAALVVVAARDAVRGRVRLALFLVGPAVLTLIVYVTANSVAFSSPFPESGVAKQLGAGGKPHWATIGDFLTLGFGDRVHDAGLLLLLLTGLALVLLLARSRLRGRWREVDQRIPVAWLLVAAVAAQLVQVAFYTMASSWGGELWYYGLVPVGLVLSLTVVLAAVPVAAPRVRLACGAIGAVVVLVLAGRIGVELAGAGVALEPEDSPMAATAAAGAWVDGALPADSRLAMGDWAGGFSWAAHRPVLQTEGLVAGHDYLDALGSGDGAAYLTRQGVQYYAKIGDRTGVPDGLGCERFTEPIYGQGPTLFVHVCDTQLIHVTPGPQVEGDVRIWRLAPSSLD